MATGLYLITNSKFTGKETEPVWEKIVDELTKLNFFTTTFVSTKNEITKDYINWIYEIENDKDEPFNVGFQSSFHIEPRLYTNIGVIYTIYKYSLIYKKDEIYWFEKFRNDLFNIITIIGGTEAIYLADNACDKLSIYLEDMALENVPYEEIKQKMIEEFGKPVTDYSKLNIKALTYKKIEEFFLDDFADLKARKKTAY